MSSWTRDQARIDELLEQRYHRPAAEVLYRDLIVAVDEDSVGLNGGLISSSRLKICCLTCGREKRIILWALLKLRSLHCISCRTRHVNLEHRDYSDPQFRRKISDCNRGKIIPLHMRLAVGTRCRGIPKSPEHRRRIAEALRRYHNNRKLAACGFPVHAG